MRPKYVMLLGFVNKAVEYLDKHMDEEPDTRLAELKNIDLASIKDELSDNLDASLGTMQSTMSSLLKAGNEAFDKFIEDNLGKEISFDKFEDNFVDDFDVDDPSSKKTIALDKNEELAKLLAFYNLEDDINVDELKKVELPKEQDEYSRFEEIDLDEDDVKVEESLDDNLADLDDDLSDLIDTLDNTSELTSTDTLLADETEDVDVEIKPNDSIEENVDDVKDDSLEVIDINTDDAVNSDITNEISKSDDNIDNISEDDELINEIIKNMALHESEDADSQKEVEHIEEDKNNTTVDDVKDISIDESVDSNEISNIFTEIVNNEGADIADDKMSGESESQISNVDNIPHIVESVIPDEPIENEVLEQQINVDDNMPHIVESVIPEEPASNNETYVNSLLDDLREQLIKEEAEKKEKEDRNREIYERISKLYPYLPNDFIINTYDLKDELAKEYEMDKKIIILHRVSFKDVDNLRKFVEIGMNHEYAINADEKKLIVDIFKEFVNSDGRILTNIYEIANQGYLLHGEYEGYNVLPNED